MRQGARAAVVLLAGACAPHQVAPLPDPLPPLPVIEVVRPGVVADSTGVALTTPGRRITMTASNAPLREMLPLIAEAAGVTLIVDPSVDARVSFHFEDVPALEALQRLATEAGYSIGEAGTGIALPFRPRTVFVRPAVNLDAMGVQAIQERFGVSRELAEWIVLSRVSQR